MNALPRLLKLSLLPLMAISLQGATYEVKSGDTLSSIARKTGTTAKKLMATNGITDPTKLRVGQTLTLPGGGSSTPSQPTRVQSTGSHTVKSGETLYSIARRHGMSVAQLTRLNPGLDPAKLAIGQKLRTSGSAPQEEEKPAPKPTPAPQPEVASASQQPKPPVASPPRPTPTPRQDPAPTPPPAAAAPTQPTAVAESAPAPTPGKPTTRELVAEGADQAPPANIKTVKIDKEISYGALASAHHTSTKELNELNALSLKPTTMLAKGSAIYVPGDDSPAPAEQN
ncbi:LysM peptidoglycan-binding domain-containing protein [Roseibacillus ishigakijimensis]|uniref:LysM peptidoglycan-binding domain-containing protein n=1 Tax=Roseibacillus ishigakijimensis TaxID=454146 RepID=A0A934RSA7_9BACT|nr:LysM peptidoglycan-binding domain-containing protein [Roseibacillus ishigakijimensis]MBK1834538.1 LysM peptidoglycan-binding domain-containing protein [Roseibacillus ishigakijimensis]